MPLGYHQPRKVDVRIIASTNRDLRAEVAAGRFRQDLYFRVNVFSVTIPPLRERVRDIVPLASYFLKNYSSRLNRHVPSFHKEAARLLESYSWPGNVRELQNEMERLVLVAEPGREIGPDLLSDYIRQGPRNNARTDGRLKTAIQTLEDEMILETMKRFHRNKSRTARALGISRQSLITKLRRIQVSE